ncbi:efflux RND transporter periplasmic adaptor subunit [Paenibacillus chartarius]|uniref:Efflux RND transporter periplasmic adaptor subunit n=1 Tax=Paenibacillus chartarius TaxID=747481 RepID=A0ABV6DU23_9BACL
MKRQWWLGLFALLLVAAGGGLYVQNGGKGEAVKTVRAAEADLIQYEQADGKVKAKEEHGYYAQTAGKLLRVDVKAGDPVTEGQLLAELDPADTALRLRQLQAQLEQVQADWNKISRGPKPEEVKVQEESVFQAQLKVNESTRAWNKARNDYDAGTVTNEELQQIENEMKLAQSALNIAQSKLSLLKQGPDAADAAGYEAKVKDIQAQQDMLNRELAHMRIAADAPGTVTELFVQENQLVDAGTKLLAVSDLSRLEIEAEVKETLISKVYVGQQAVIQGSALGSDTYLAHVVKIAPSAAPSPTSTDKKPVVTVTLALDKGSAKLLPGYNVDVNFETGRAANALQVPYSAVKQNADGTSYVWTVQEDRAVRTPVETGMKTETFIQVKQGLRAGSAVIAKPSDTLKDRQKVSVNP